MQVKGGAARFGPCGALRQRRSVWRATAGSPMCRERLTDLVPSDDLTATWPSAVLTCITGISRLNVRRLPTSTTGCESWDSSYRRVRASMRRSTLCSISRQWLPSTFRPFFATPCYRTRRRIPNVSAMSTSPYKDTNIDDVERPDYYRPGGYHPIKIGERLRDRYAIVHKLGSGSYSTIWLARDEQLDKYVAIKIGTADHSSKEIDILSQLSAVAENTQPGRRLIPLILDRFVLHGPNGIHPCSVTAPARCSLAEVLEPGSGPFQLCVARSLAAQLAMAVAYIHHFGYVHGGELMNCFLGGMSGHL